MTFEEFMFWLPFCLLFFFYMGATIYAGGISMILFWIVILIVFIFIILWSDYWLSKKMRREGGSK